MNLPVVIKWDICFIFHEHTMTDEIVWRAFCEKCGAEWEKKNIF